MNSSEPDTAPSRSESLSARGPDLNTDGSVNALNLQLEVNVVLGSETNLVVRSRADMNGDGSVNALDLQKLVNLVLGL